MPGLSLLVLAGAALQPAAAGPLPSAASAIPPAESAHPATRTGEDTDVYHGTAVSDPYRWLEADIRASDEVRAWVTSQNRVTRAYLDAIPEREAIEGRLAALSNIEQVNTPMSAGGRFFYRRRGPGEEQASLWVRDRAGGEDRRLLDPASWSADGSAALAAVVVERRGRLVAYAVQEAGSDWRTWRVIDAETGRLLPDAVRWNKFSDVFWDGRGEGFYYTRFPEPPAGAEYLAGNAGQQLYYHRLGDPQSADRLIYEDPANPDHLFIGALSADGRHLFINNGYNGGGPGLLHMDLRRPGAFRPLFAPSERPLTSHRLVGARGSTLYILSNLDAPNGRLVAIDADDPGAPPRVVIPESRFPLTWVRHSGGRFFAHHLEDSKSRVRIFDERGRARGEVALPGAGTARGFGGGEQANSVYYEYSDFATPFSIYRYDIARGTSTVVRRPEGPVSAEDYQVDQVFFTARDGKRIPMFIASRRGTARGPHTPVLLYGYGGFGLSFSPDFRPEQVTWMDMGGIFAFPALPGGGEYGEAWHAAGMLERKPAVFEAFIDAAQYLIDNGYTNPRRLAIFGYSNGGLLVGATVARRPDLFAVALPTVGVLDMLRFPQFTNGRLWSVEYGSPQDAGMFPVLRGYSPYHNIVPGTRYPAMLIGTADTDDRVYPAHSFKYAARMQANAAPGNPVLLNIETNSGHGAGTRRSQVVESAADRLAFTLRNLGFALPEDFPGYEPR